VFKVWLIALPYTKIKLLQKLLNTYPFWLEWKFLKITFLGSDSNTEVNVSEIRKLLDEETREQEL